MDRSRQERLAGTLMSAQVFGQRRQETSMQDHIYKVIELVGSSETSIEDADHRRDHRANQTIRHLRWFEGRADARPCGKNGKYLALSGDAQGRLHHGEAGRSCVRTSPPRRALVRPLRQLRMFSSLSSVSFYCSGGDHAPPRRRIGRVCVAGLPLPSRLRPYRDQPLSVGSSYATPGDTDRHSARDVAQPSCRSTCSSSSKALYFALRRGRHRQNDAHHRSGGKPRRVPARCTRPTGFPLSSGSGPARPVIATATSAGERCNAPSAIAHTTVLHTAPSRASTSAAVRSAAVLFGLV